jgi:hypothetical protein
VNVCVSVCLCFAYAFLAMLLAIPLSRRCRVASSVCTLSLSYALATYAREGAIWDVSRLTSLVRSLVWNSLLVTVRLANFTFARA